MVDDTHVTLKEYTEVLVRETRLLAEMRALHLAQNVTLARAELQVRLEGMNHIKEQNTQLAAQMATKDTVGALQKEVNELKANRYQTVINLLIGAALAWIALQFGGGR